MRKEGMVLVMLMLILAATGVYAVGSTTFSEPSAGQEVVNQEPTSCETYATLKERIKCRLENDEEGPSTPEACASLPSTAATADEITLSECRKLYVAVGETNGNCYSASISGIEKARCLRTQAGLTTLSLEKQRDDVKAIKLYIVGLLYDLQERVEKAFKNGEITSDQAAEMIDLIVRAKERVMEKAETKTQVVSVWNIIKSKWSELGIR